jgi:Ca2+-binding RTX toxin-like protein
MSVVLLLLMAATVGFVATDLLNKEDDASGSSDEATPDALPDAPPDDEGEQALVTLVTDGLQATGGDGVDSYILDPAVEGTFTTSITAGNGDDSIDLGDTYVRGGPFLAGGQIDGGAGDDVIMAVGGGSTITGGAGDDTIAGSLLGSSVTGGEGDDSINVLSVGGDATTVDGGAGNDTLDGTLSDNIRLLGGAGDDVITTAGVSYDGTNFFIVANGGEGNDTLTHEVEVFPLPRMHEPGLPATYGPRMAGGAGADSFEFVLTSEGGSYTPYPDDPTIFINDAARIVDFERGVDTLSIDLSALDPRYVVESGQLRDDTARGTTVLSLRLTSDTLPTQLVQITVSPLGLRWGDVTFIGQAPATLAVA